MVSAAALALALTRRTGFGLDGRWTVPALMCGVAIAVEVVPSFSYASPSAHRGALHVTACTCLLAAAAWVGRARRAVPWLAAVGYLVAAAWVIRSDPAPRIDV